MQASRARCSESRRCRRDRRKRLHVVWDWPRSRTACPYELSGRVQSAVSEVGGLRSLAAQPANAPHRASIDFTIWDKQGLLGYMWAAPLCGDCPPFPPLGAPSRGPASAQALPWWLSVSAVHRAGRQGEERYGDRARTPAGGAKVVEEGPPTREKTTHPTTLSRWRHVARANSLHD